MQFDLPRFQAVSDRLLEAALIPQMWSDVLAELAQSTGSISSDILPLFGRAPGVPVSESIGEAMQAYFDEGWHINDFRNRGIPHLLRHGSMLEQDFATLEDVRHQQYYKFLAKHDLRWTAIVGFRSGNDGQCFVFYRTIGSGPYDREEELHLRAIRERLSLSASLMRAVGESHVDGIGDAFDMIDLACIFLDRQGKTTKINQRAERLLGADVQIRNREIRGRNPNESKALGLRIKKMVSASFADMSDEPEPLVLTQVGKRPLLVRIARLRGIPADIFSHSVAVAVIEDLNDRKTTSIDGLVRLFGLTRKEAEIALQLAASDSARTIADRSGISYETARSYLKSIYRKMDTDRQSQIAALLSGLRVG